jgi:spore coat protein YutH
VSVLPEEGRLPALIERNYDEQITGRRWQELFFFPADRFIHHQFAELARVADYLNHYRIIPCCRVLPKRDGTYLLEVDGTASVLLQRPSSVPADQANLRIGAMLAAFHRATRGADPRRFRETPFYERIDRLITRKETLDRRYRALLAKGDPDRFERHFLNSYLYFSGCAENAIQYFVDIGIDFPVPEPLVLTHDRFSGPASLIPENPARWVADARGRDLAEWLRWIAWNETGEEAIRSASLFLDDYESVFPLSDQAAAYLFGRLLFPFPYVDCCEQYFAADRLSPGEREELSQLLLLHEGRIRRQERMLAYLGRRRKRLPLPEWLVNR